MIWIGLLLFIFLCISLRETFTNSPPTLFKTTLPVDMLQESRDLLVRGYRFQNNLWPVKPYKSIPNLKEWTPPPRVGVFKPSAYLDLTGGGATLTGTIVQMEAQNVQSRELIGSEGQPIEDNGANYRMLGKYVGYAPYHSLSVPIFSWADMANRYFPSGSENN